MKERLRRRQLPAFVGILTIIGLFAAILILHLLMRYLGYVFNTPIMEYVEYAVFILIGILIIRNWITEYEYAVIDDALYVDRYLGKRPRRLFEVGLADIGYIGERLPDDFKGKKQRLTFKPKGRALVYIIYQNNAGNEKCAVISPSKDMLDLINTRMAKKS